LKKKTKKKKEEKKTSVVRSRGIIFLTRLINFHA